MDHADVIAFDEFIATLCKIIHRQLYGLLDQNGTALVGFLSDLSRPLGDGNYQRIIALAGFQTSSINFFRLDVFKASARRMVFSSSAASSTTLFTMT